MTESFTPTYDAFFPEWFLTGEQTETLVHDLSPVPSLIGKVEHGRRTHPPGADPPQVWITEINLRPWSGPTSPGDMSPADRSHVASKNVLRYLTAYVNKGMTALDLYAAADKSGYALVDDGFYQAIGPAGALPRRFPGGRDHGRGAAPRPDADASSGPVGPTRSLSLDALTDFSGNVQFQGDGTPQYPSLYNREVFAFLPFVDSHRFVIPVYVMTRNTVEVYDRSSDDPSRFDMPPELYRMAIGGVDGSEAEATATDPLSGASVPVQTISRSPESIVVEICVTILRAC